MSSPIVPDYTPDSDGLVVQFTSDPVTEECAEATELYAADENTTACEE